MMKRCVVKALTTLAFAFLLASLAHSQASRTWVSGVGDDANPCSRTAPCKTFAGAISKTAAKGEISVLDPGGFGAVTITKSITLNGDGNLGSILASGSNGITINAGSTDVVILRSLSLNGVSLGLDGVRFIAGALLVVENCSIYGFTQSGINVDLTTGGNLAMKNVSITGGAIGVRVSGSSGSVNASLSDVSIKGSGNGIDALFGTTEVRDSIISQSSGTGVFAEAGTVTVMNTALTGNLFPRESCVIPPLHQVFRCCRQFLSLVVFARPLVNDLVVEDVDVRQPDGGASLRLRRNAVRSRGRTRVPAPKLSFRSSAKLSELTI
jgi:hypothetical protein